MNALSGQISQIKSLENGKGLQCLINKASEILRNPLVLFNMEYELMYCTENVVTDDILWNEIVGTGIFSSETIKFFMEECFIDAVACTESTAILRSDKLKYDRLYGRVFNSYRSTVADLIMVVCDNPISEEDIMIFQVVCEKLSQEIASNEFFTKYGILYNESLIRGLLDADIGDKVIYSGHMSNLYEGLKENLYVVVVDIGKSSNSKNTSTEIRNLFKKIQPELKYALYSDYIVIVASTEEASFDIKRELHGLSEYFNDNNICCGISSRFENLFNLREYYNEAVIGVSSNKKVSVS